MKMTPKRVGILGAGQLARMLAMASGKLNIQCRVLADKKTDCAIPVAAGVTYNDKRPATLRQFCAEIDVLTTENEFIDLRWLEDGLGSTPFFPGLDCLKQIQNKLTQKESLLQKNIPTLEYIRLNSKEDLHRVPAKLGSAFVIKAARNGYDGKGTFIFGPSRPLRVNEFWDQVSQTSGFSGYAERLISFKKELAVIVARSVNGEVASYPVVETHQENGMCRWVVAPAAIDGKTALEAQKIARQVIESFNGIGVFGVEMFLTENDQVVINEVAPRVHNSGHLTMDLCDVGQFEMHLRAITGLPLTGTSLNWPAGAMANVIGQKDALTQNFRGESEPGENLWPHWYGKSGESLGRKLGHINAAGETQKAALKKAVAALTQFPV
jgi:phosphoribosylaminoimidazole carboxylase PurK protein